MREEVYTIIIRTFIDKEGIQNQGTMSIGGKIKDGIFEYVFDLDGSCNHRLFREVK